MRYSIDVLQLLDVNFSRPWWELIKKQRWSVIAILSEMALYNIFWALLPFFISYVFSTKSFFVCFLLAGLWLLLNLSYIIVGKISQVFQLRCIHSIYKSAHERMLTVDPQYHVHRSSGVVLAKIERGARGYEDFADYVTFDIVPLVSGLIAVFITLAHYSWLLTGIMAILVLIIVYAGYYLALHKAIVQERQFITADDKYKSVAAENIQQVYLIRSTFATESRVDLLKRRVSANALAEGNLWYTYFSISVIINMLYYFSAVVLMFFLVWQIAYHSLNPAVAFGLFMAYLQASREITKVHKMFRRTMKSLTAIRDLYAFMASFGKQTFPVLEETSCARVPSTTLSVSADAISFDYGKATLFNGHTFFLEVARTAPTKLYGIIGPSGSGKSTLLSILGGQLRPLQGSIYINGINIYEVDDKVRRSLIALQGQVATTLYGTIKDMLLLGLPVDHGYTDHDLIHVLERVGLWHVLQLHKGLETPLGEGGLNLSGGQRQRLNFAGLYIRALYYKPSLILIDEPTSSLDEVSEAAITTMIQELSKDAITFVIAHRLKTVEQAVGLIDLSLLHTTTHITVCPAQELRHVSLYYKELLAGNIQLDS